MSTIRSAILVSTVGVLAALGPAWAQEETASGALPLRTVHVIPIDGDIDWTQHAFILRATSAARKARPDIAIFEIDSPGGRIDAMEAIAQQIFRTEDAGIMTIAFIRPGKETSIGGAYSAASYIAMACQSIYIHPRQSFGDAQPILIGPEGIQEGPEKIKSPMRAKFRAVADRRGYPV
ncbi:MAG: hypothetical protein ACYTAF_17515, partial [Planctomycetota bacterium]